MYNYYFQIELDPTFMSLKVRCFIVQIATATDAALVPGTEIYYLHQIYVLLFCIFILLIVYIAGVKLRSTFKKLRGDNDDK